MLDIDVDTLDVCINRIEDLGKFLAGKSQKRIKKINLSIFGQNLEIFRVVLKVISNQE